MVLEGKKVLGRSIAKYQRGSAHKARAVLDRIRGKRCTEVLLDLKYLGLKPAVVIYNALLSALANAGQASNLDLDDLVITEAFVNQGPALKRFRSRAQGRVFSIKKPTCHITIGVGIK
jgi:large subunit ribosomal protein L22